MIGSLGAYQGNFQLRKRSQSREYENDDELREFLELLCERRRSKEARFGPCDQIFLG
jgi:hypothetical protein